MNNVKKIRFAVTGCVKEALYTEFKKFRDSFLY